MQIARSNTRALRPPKRPGAKTPIDKAKAYEVIWQQVAPICEAARPLANAEWVYVIGEPDDGPIKIGHSKDPIGRLRTMQTGNARRLRIERLLIGDPYTEKLLHELWRAHSIFSARTAGKAGAIPGTEWFKPEIRTTFDPIICAAVQRQIDVLSAPLEGQELNVSLFSDAVRLAHVEHDHVAQGQDITRLLGAAGGIVHSRVTRI